MDDLTAKRVVRDASDKRRVVTMLIKLDNDFNAERDNLAAGREYDLDDVDVETLKTLLLNAWDDLEYVLDEVRREANKARKL